MKEKMRKEIRRTIFSCLLSTFPFSFSFFSLFFFSSVLFSSSLPSHSLGWLFIAIVLAVRPRSRTTPRLHRNEKFLTCCVSISPSLFLFFFSLCFACSYSLCSHLLYASTLPTNQQTKKNEWKKEYKQKTCKTTFSLKTLFSHFSPIIASKLTYGLPRPCGLQTGRPVDNSSKTLDTHLSRYSYHASETYASTTWHASLLRVCWRFIVLKPEDSRLPSKYLASSSSSYWFHYFSPSYNMAQSATNNRVGVHYKVGKKIGEGSFGIIFEGINLLNNQQVAIKFEPRKCEAPQLRDEYRSYRILNDTEGVPRAYFFGQEGVHNILVIDLLGPSLEDLFDWCGRRFSTKTVVQVAKQMIERVRSIHEHNLIYRDVKPDNFLIGKPDTPEANMVYIVDFGMAKQYRDPKTKTHIPYREKKALSGTARYMSINTHLGREQLRRDDLESLGHVFMYFLRGLLPWQGLKAPTNKQKYEKIGMKKQTTSINELCYGFPIQFAQYLTYVRNLKFEEEPDYTYLIGLMDKALVSIDETEDGHYDWMDLNGGRGWDAALNKKANLHGYGNPHPPQRPRKPVAPNVASPQGRRSPYTNRTPTLAQRLRSHSMSYGNYNSTEDGGFRTGGPFQNGVADDADLHSDTSSFNARRKLRSWLRRLFCCF